jgi:predicted CXXCH cytochrome family protein
MIKNVYGCWRLVAQSACILIVLAGFATAQAGPLPPQQAQSGLPGAPLPPQQAQSGLPGAPLPPQQAQSGLPGAPLQDAATKASCSTYQDPKTIEPLRKFKEPALEKGCIACHLDCNQLSPANQKEPPEYYLKEKEPALCLECHSASAKDRSPAAKDLAPAHDNQPLGESKCSGCHDPHSSDVPNRLPRVSHGPYAARLCSACHPKPVNNRIRLTAADVDSLCYTCHTQFKAETEGAKSRHKLLSQSDRSCMECHDPHATNQEYVLKQPAQDLCTGCHVAGQKRRPQTAPGGESMREITAASMRDEDTNPQYLKLSSKYVHEPVRTSCLICHDAHTSAFPKELRVSVKDLCMGCHGPNSEKIVQSSQPFPLFGGLVSLPPKTFAKLPHFELSGKYVHEPVNVSCAFCHDAHASGEAMELYAPVTDLCLACHGSNGIELIRSQQPFPLFGGKVSVPPKSFEKLFVLDLVQGRFGHPTAAHPVFVAATKDKAELNCVSCHNSHSASTSPKLLLEGDEKTTCKKCHADLSRTE